LAALAGLVVQLARPAPALASVVISALALRVPLAASVAKRASVVGLGRPAALAVWALQRVRQD
jgi:hypothetical protein